MEKHQEKIAVAIDARDGKAAVKGWLETSDCPVDDFIRDMARRGVRHFIYTDIAATACSSISTSASSTTCWVSCGAGDPAPPLIYSGGVTSIEDVVALNEHSLEGCIVGTALYDGRIDLELARTGADHGRRHLGGTPRVSRASGRSRLRTVPSESVRFG